MSDANDFIPTRQSLLSRLKDWNDRESWKVFFDTYAELIYNAAVRAGLSDAEAQDVVQETVISVAKKIPEFRYEESKGSFKAWLMRLVQWRVLNQIRKRQKDVVPLRNPARPLAETGTGDQIPDPALSQLEATWNEEWERNLVETAIRRVKSRVDARHYQIFDLHVGKKWPVSKVARDMKISSARVYLIKHRIGAMVKEEIAHLQHKPI